MNDQAIAKSNALSLLVHAFALRPVGSPKIIPIPNPWSCAVIGFAMIIIKPKTIVNNIFFFITLIPFIVFEIYLTLKLIVPKFVFCCATTITFVMVVSL